MLATVLILAVSGLLMPQQDDTIRDFKRYFKRSKDSRERVEFVHALETIDDPEVAKLLLPILSDKDMKVAQAARLVISRLPSPESRAPLYKTMEKGKKPHKVQNCVQNQESNDDEGNSPGALFDKEGNVRPVGIRTRLVHFANREEIENLFLCGARFP